MRKIIFVVFFILLTDSFYSYGQAIKNEETVINGNVLNISFDIEPYSLVLSNEERYRVNIFYKAIFGFDKEEKEDWFNNPQNSNRKLNFPDQNKLFSPGKNKSFSIDIGKVSNFSQFFGKNKETFTLALQLEPVFIPIKMDTVKKKKINKDQVISFYGPKDDVTYTITISKNNEDPVLEEELRSDPSSVLQYLEFKLDKSVETGEYTLNISSNNYGNDEKSSPIILKKSNIILPLVGIVVVGTITYFLLVKKGGTLKIPLLPEPPDPNG